jgi:hypothetical protein
MNLIENLNFQKWKNEKIFIWLKKSNLLFFFNVLNLTLTYGSVYHSPINNQ